MFTMALLRIILLFSVITVSCQALSTNVSDTCSQNTSDEIQVLKVEMAKQNIKIEKMKMKIVELEKVANNSETGSIFTRWGRRDCPGNVSQLVYSGITGGGYWTHTGAAAEYVCLPPDPSWNKNKFAKGTSNGYMFGTEYQEYLRQGLVDYQVPCAVCQTSQFSKVLMIPAKSECYTGWQKAYHGELVSGKYDHEAATQYVCLDDDPQTNGTNDDNNGKLMYAVRAMCGSLPCPPYEDNARLTCVVCLK